MTATVSIILAERQNVIKVPNAAFRFRPAEAIETNQLAKAAGETSGSGDMQTSGGPGGVRDGAGRGDRAGGGGGGQGGRRREGGGGGRGQGGGGGAPGAAARPRPPERAGPRT